MITKTREIELDFRMNRNIANMKLTLQAPRSDIFFLDMFMNFTSDFIEDDFNRYRAYDDCQVLCSYYTEKPYNKLLFLKKSYYITAYAITEDEHGKKLLLDVDVSYISNKKPCPNKVALLFKFDRENDIGMIVKINETHLSFTQVSYSRTASTLERYDRIHNFITHEKGQGLGYLRFFTEA